MGMTANQILSKALSTESEDEAISCLKMARKKGLKLDGDINKGYSEGELKHYARVISALEGDISDKLRLNERQRKEIYHPEDRLYTTRDRVYSLEAWLMVTAVAIAVELVVIIILTNGG
jgi:flagellar biosynthesis chaperone FliJ